MILIGSGLLGAGIYLLVHRDASFDMKTDAMITQKRYIGHCIYEYEFKVNNSTYHGSYVADTMCITQNQATVEVKYSSKDPSHNSATIFGSFPPRKLEGLEIAGCVLIAFGSCLIMISFVAICVIACRKHANAVEPTSAPAKISDIA